MLSTGGCIVGVGYLFGLAIGLYGTIMEQGQPWHIVTLAGVAGVFGSLVDSFLGATIQYSGWDEDSCCVVETAGKNVKHISGRPILDNHAVNLMSSTITAYATTWMAQRIFY